MKKRTYVIAAGGTGGHIIPGIAVAEKIKEKEPDANVLFCGTKKGMENSLVKREGFRVLHISAKGFSGKISMSNIAAILFFVIGTIQSINILKRYKVDVVIGMGGYVCAPMVYACRIVKTKVVLHEQNAFPGKANRWLSKYASAVCISYPDTVKYFNKAKKVVVTGNPVRKVFYGLKKEHARKKLGLKPDEKIVLVTGGSLGALSINETLVEMAKKHINLNYKLILVTGSLTYERIKEKAKRINKHLVIKEYLHDIHLYMAACNLVISRAGAITCSEIALLGKASVMIPYPYAAGDHQTLNAKMFYEIGASLIIKDSDLNEDLMFETIDELINDKERIEKMEKLALSLGYPSAGELVYLQLKK